MVGKLHLWQEDMLKSEGDVTIGVTLEQPGCTRSRLWYRLPEEHTLAITKACDPFVVGTIFKAMREPADMIVHGEVSPVLLRNLEQFQSVWACWLPETLHQIEIAVDSEKEQTHASTSHGAICAFSGGVDAAFTAWRHHTGRCGRSRQSVQAGVQVHGFDIPLEQRDAFDRAVARSRRMLSSIGMDVIPVATNFRELGDNWERAHGAGVASCLIALQAGWKSGLLGSTYSYDNLILPWGSNPLTDRLLSTGSFEIVHDGAEVHRTEKIRELANWPEALKYLWVCWHGDPVDRNCCHCRKCIRTILEFRAAGRGLPECFEQDVNNLQIAFSGSGASEIGFLSETLETTKANGISGSWIWAAQLCLCISRLRRVGKHILFRQR